MTVSHRRCGPKSLPARLVLCLFVILLNGCASLPSLSGRVASQALRQGGDTKLGKAITPLAADNGARPSEPRDYLEPGRPVRAGLYALAGGREALAARVALADAAELGLDIQYYYWRDDRSGTFLFNAIRRAANRGVRVRLLIDDNNTAGQDPVFLALDRHPNIEVRLFNPFAQRGVRILGFLTDFERVNRRMHNKSFTADNQATIIGGRNIGDEYFDATDERAFADLDVLAVGAIVDQMSTDFDRYWASESAYPVERLLKPASDEAMDGLMSQVDDAETGAAFQDYSEAVRDIPFLRELFEGRLKLEWATTRIVSDDPGKVLQGPAAQPSLPAKMEELIGKPKQLLEMVSPYFVPMQDGLDYLKSLAAEGVQIHVLTNSLAATDVVAVHAGYSRWRKPLLATGITLHEYKPASPTPGSRADAPGGRRLRTLRSGGFSSAETPGGGDLPGANSARSVGVGGLLGAIGAIGSTGEGGSGASGGSGTSAGARISGGSGGSAGSGAAAGSRGSGSSSSSLHAKTYSVDRSRVVIGSFNFDPRSLDLNTELSVVIDSAALASSVDDAYGRNVPRMAYQVSLADSGELRWTEEVDGARVLHEHEPEASFWRRVGAAVIGLLPIDPLL